MVESLTAAQARRIALAAQGFGSKPSAVGTRQLGIALQRLGILQLDSVNVFERSHYLPLFARLGAYDKALLDRITHGKRSVYTEYWAHEAAVIPMETRPLWHWKMQHRREAGKNISQWGRDNPAMLEELRAQLRARGALTAGQIEHEANKRKGTWWAWSDVKAGLEVLFLWGEVVTADRKNFERSYVLAEQRIPADILGREVAKPDGIRELVRRAARSHGVGTQRDIADYFRLPQDVTKTAILELVEAGDLQPVTVRGWNKPAWLHRDARIPRRIETTALLSPFDPVVWERERALRMFGFHYRIEIYTPAAKRVYGYYTLPLLIDDQIVGRIDLKNDRHEKVLRVQSAWREDGATVDVDRVRVLLREIADWQGLGDIAFADRGNLIAKLATSSG